MNKYQWGKNLEDDKFFSKFKENHLYAKDHPELIGKKAKFKDKLVGYSWYLWNQKGVIVESDRNPYLSLKFDNPEKLHWRMEMCFIAKDSIKLI